MSAQSGRGGVGSRKHGRGGHPGHNRDMIQIARELNRDSDEQAARRSRKRNKMVSSVRELFGRR